MMGWSRSVAVLLAIVGIAAGGSVIWTISDWMHDKDRLASVAQPQSPFPPAVDLLAPRRIEPYVTTILGRPLFNADRRPSATSGAEVTGLPRLTGIVISGAEKVAIFSVSASSRPVVAGEGARVGNYDIRVIDPAGVTVEGPEGIRTVRPLFDPNAPAPQPRGAEPKSVAAPRKR